MRYQWFRRGTAAALAACLLTSNAAAAVLHQSSLRLTDDLLLEATYSQQEKTSVREKILTYTPGGDVQPVVVYGDTLYGRSTMDYIREYLDEQNLSATAAINAAFFDMSTGIPYGMVVTDGILRSSGEGYTICIWENGRLEIGNPMLQMELIWNGQSIKPNYNKALSKQSGYCLYSRDYDTKTKNSISAYNLVLEAPRGELKVSDQIQATVKQIIPDTASCAIPEGCFVLSLATETDYATAMEQMKQIKVGDQVVITTTINRGSESIRYAVGGGDLLVENGKPLTEFVLESAKRPAARTAIGIKSNGEVVCYTADKSSGSAGLTLAELAQRMVELGCVSALNMDGGGSTTAGVTLPGDTTFGLINDPADGAQRPCANFLFFVRETALAGSAARLHLYPYDGAVLPGGQVELTVKATDADYRAAQVPAGVTLSASGGTVSGMTFTASAPGTARVTAAAGGISGSVDIQVVQTPTDMTVLDSATGREVKELLLEVGGLLDLTAEAEYLGMELAARDTSFTWQVEESLGTVDAEGVFTAVSEGKGTLVVTCGQLTENIPVEVRKNPFTDTQNHWARSPIAQLYFKGVVQGSGGTDGILYYRPDDSMTRQEFVVSMVRASGVDVKKYKDEELPFDDADTIASWAEDAVKAAYALGWFTGSGKGDQLYAQPAATITREAAMTMLARSISVSSESDALDQFADAGRVSSWARAGMTAMVEKGIINGMDGKLQPQGNVTRAQVAKMLYMMQ